MRRPSTATLPRMQAAPRHTCSICGREARPRGRLPGVTEGAAEPSNPSFPFCSPACKMLDLGRWLDGSYRIPGPPAESTLDGDDE